MARRYALVIGISKYQSPLPPLSRPAKDAEAVGKVLEEYGNFESLRVLNSTRANGQRVSGWVSHEQLDQVLTQFLEQQAANQDALIYFTGHGFIVEESPDDQRGYLATSDCCVEFEGGRIVTQRRGVSFQRLNNLIQRANLSSLVLLLDCCHSGDFVERSLVEKTFTAFNKRKDYSLITACRGFEQSYAKTSEEHSIFTGALLAGLSQSNKNDKGQVTGYRLFDHIATELQGSGQEPIHMGYGGLITLVSYQPEPTVVTAIVDETGEPICPYRGLQAFTAEQREFFFGRKHVVEEIRRRLEEKPFVPIIGASGSGKSSIVQAGLIPWLEETGWTVLAPMKAGFEPLSALKAVFEPFFPRSPRDIQQLYQLIRNEPNPLPALINRLSHACSRESQSGRFLLVVDQFEELFTLCADEGDRQRFIDLITQVVDLEDARLAVVITMRADFLEPCLRYPKLLQLLEAPKNLASPTGLDLKDVIVKPAQRQGYDIEERLLFQIQEDVGKEPGFLPLLEFALTKLWENRDRERKLLTLEQYENLGGLTGALDLHAERVYQFRDFERESPTDPRSEQEQEWIKRVFLRLVRTGEAEKDTRQRRSKAELLAIAETDSDAQELLRGLIEDEGGLVRGRLLVSDRVNDQDVIDLSHEALLDGWSRFAEWRKGDREVRRLVDRMEDFRREWEQHQRSDDFLLPKGVLTQAEPHGENLLLHLTSALEEFFYLSKDHEQQRESAYEWVVAEEFINSYLPKVRELLPQKPIEAMAIAIQLTGLHLDKSNKPLLTSIQDALYFTMESVLKLRSIPLSKTLEGFSKHTYSVAFSPNGSTLASGGIPATIRLWRLQEEAIETQFQLEEGDVYSLAFSPNGNLLASGYSDGYIRLWDRRSNSLYSSWKGHRVTKNVVFSSDSKTVISSGETDSLIRLWDLQGNLIKEIDLGKYSEVWDIAFNSKDETFAVAVPGYLSFVRIYNLQGNLVKELLQDNYVNPWCVAFSPDGRTIAAGLNNSVCLLDLDGNLLTKPMLGHEEDVISIAFSPNGQTIATASNDGALRLWDLSGNPLGQPLETDSGWFHSIAFSPDGRLIASGSSNGAVQLWLGDWRGWLETCCEQLYYYIDVAHPESKEIFAACQVCQKYVWDRE